MRSKQTPEAKDFFRKKPVVEATINRIKGGELIQERVRKYNWMIGNIYGCAPADSDLWTDCWMDLMSINRVTAFRMLAYLPDPLLRNEESDRAEKELLQKLKHPHIGVAAWLLYWDKEGNLEDLHKSGFTAYQPYALLSRRRFDLIQGLFDLGRFDFHPLSKPKPAFFWLLSEISLCIDRLGFLGIRYEGDHQSISSKRSAYEYTQKSIERLKDIDQPIQLPEVKVLLDLLENFNLLIECEAQNVATENEIFNLQYYKPYLSAFSAYNSARVKNSSLQFLCNSLPKRRGPQIREREKSLKLRETIRR